MTPADAKAQAAFLTPLVTNVLCRQMLPAAISPATSALGIEAVYQLRFYSLQDTHHAAVTATVQNSTLQQPDDPASPVLIGGRLSKEQQQFFNDLEKCRLALLTQILNHAFSQQHELHLSFLLPAACRTMSDLQLSSRINISIPFSFSHYTNRHEIIDILAQMLADNLDLTSLLPFLSS